MKRHGRRREAPPPADPRDLLRQVRTGGYPPEYVASRLRARRSRLIRDWRPLLYGGPPAEHLASPQYGGFVRERTLDGIRRSLQREYAWVFSQLDEGMRRVLAPYFLYVELGTIAVCLRLLKGEQAQESAAVLAASLLSRELRAALGGGTAEDAVEEVERAFSGVAPGCRGMAEVHGEKGLRAVEQLLVNGYLSAVIARPLPPVLRGLFARIIDSRNVLSLSISLRIGARDRSVFIPGGTIGAGRLDTLQERGDPFEVIWLVRQTAGISLTSPEPAQVEVALYRGITRYLRREGREPLGAGLVLDHLWRCSLEVTNLSVLFAAKDMEPGEVAAELVQ
jgi:vacuolar-type H+-ATPase subunit C/Vma6